MVNQEEREKELARIEKRLANIDKKFKKEVQNLIDSGMEDSPDYASLYCEIQERCKAEKFPWILKRNKLIPYTGKERDDLNYDYAINLKYPPEGEELKELLAAFRKDSKKQIS